jgi:group I intron endonuclease
VVSKGNIYLIKNLINGKSYVGKTVFPIADRYKHHIRQMRAGSQYALHRAIRKYGQENFELTLLEKVNDLELLDAREIFWIKHLDTANKKFGYNLTLGGEGRSKYSEEYILEFISLYNNGMSINQICKTFNIDKETLTRHFTKQGIKTDKYAIQKFGYTEEAFKRAVDIYEETYSQEQTAKRLGVSSPTIRTLFKKFNYVKAPLQQYWANKKKVMANGNN